jgi:hypothetical protein
MSRLPAPAEKHVAAATAVTGIPPWLRMEGFTKAMYAMVMNGEPGQYLRTPSRAESFEFEVNAAGLRRAA